MGPPGPGSSQYGSRYSMSRTCGPRDIISLVIPRLGDNISSNFFMTVLVMFCWFSIILFYFFNKVMLHNNFGFIFLYVVLPYLNDMHFC
jgi:hypothetical protein